MIAAGAIGNVLEWYDFAIYGYFATSIGRTFFPREDPVAQLLSSFGIFAVGYLMRPLGGALVGHIGDKFGRRAALTFSVAAMALPTFLVGVLPGYDTLGVAGGAAVLADASGRGSLGDHRPTRLRAVGRHVHRRPALHHGGGGAGVGALHRNCVGLHITLGVIGGLSPLVATWLANRTENDLPPAYMVMIAAAVSFLAVRLFTENSRGALPA